MKSLELKPTYENLLKTFLDDTIDRNIDIHYFIDILDSIEDSCSIGLDGAWGSGKTFFVKQVKMVVDALNPYTNTKESNDISRIQSVYSKYNKDGLIPQVCVYYDAWENDNDDDPVMSLVYTILKSVNSDFSFKNHDYLKIAGGILEFFVQKNWGQLVDGLKGDDPLKTIETNKNIESMVNEFLETLLSEKGERLIIFIDELDRCKPSYTVHLLERIKHYFSNDRITFVFSVNTQELQHTIMRYYGSEFDASRYLDRFFDLRVSLSTPNMKKFYQSIDYNSDSNYYFDLACMAVIERYDFTLREISKYIRLSKLLAQKIINNNLLSTGFPDDNARRFSLYFIVPLIIGLKLVDINMYDNFINGKDYSPLLEMAKFFDKGIFGKFLLNHNETFYAEEIKEGNSITFVRLEDTLLEIYNALFVRKYDYRNHSTSIGRLEFNDKIKKDIIKTTTLLSEYTSVEKEKHE